MFHEVCLLTCCYEQTIYLALSQCSTFPCFSSCDGGCRRSFHPTIEHGEDSKCTTLGLTEEQWQKHVALGVYFGWVSFYFALVFFMHRSWHFVSCLSMIIQDKDLYISKNSESKQHQCFACGSLGSSDLTSGPEVCITHTFHYLSLIVSILVSFRRVEEMKFCILIKVRSNRYSVVSWDAFLYCSIF